MRVLVLGSGAREHAIVARLSGEAGIDALVAAPGNPGIAALARIAAGKGVVIAEDRSGAEAAIAAAMTERKFGAAGERLVVEECLTGPEVSFFALSDGTRALPLASAQDHKRIFDEDRGPNTGGMGAFAPTPPLDRPPGARVR